MEPRARAAFNAVYTDDVYRRYTAALTGELGEVPFRLAETPLFLPRALRDRLGRHAVEILAALAEPAALERMRRAIPARFDAPGCDALPNCVQVDFAIVRGDDGELDGRVVELQGFPSLYAFSLYQWRAWARELLRIPGAAGPWSIFFDDTLDFDRAARRFADVVLADHDPAEVVLLDLAPAEQKTLPDFVATRKLLGIDAICPTELVREGRRLSRKKDGRLVPVRRIYNRVVFDELEKKGAALPYDYRDELDVTWCPHPNWYWTWSKFSLPNVRHAAIPEATLLSQVDAAALPDDLSGYVLKPLFSFAGAGVKVDVTRADLAAVPGEQREGWLLQRKIHYARELKMPDGNGVAAELRVMCLRAPGEAAPRPVWHLVRLSRGKMLGVDQNRDLTWVGSSLGLWPQP